ncbi:MAG: hypothetical protein QM730_13515 [Anaerolineales bacterium]
MQKSALPGPDNIYRETLSNGITVVTRSNFNSPSVVVSGFSMLARSSTPMKNWVSQITSLRR